MHVLTSCCLLSFKSFILDDRYMLGIFIVIIPIPPPLFYRLPLLLRKTMEKKRGKHNGQLHKEHYMVFNHPKPATFSQTRPVIGSSPRLLSKPNAVLRLLGTLSSLNSLSPLFYHF